MTIYSLTKQVRQSLKKLAAFLPTKLPIGVEAFNTWAADILATYEFPDNDSTRWALASMIMHLGPTTAYKPKRYFGLAIYAGASKQIAGNVFHEIKTRQQEAQKAAAVAEAARQVAEASKKTAEATAALQPGASNVIPI